VPAYSTWCSDERGLPDGHVETFAHIVRLINKTEFALVDDDWPDEVSIDAGCGCVPGIRALVEEAASGLKCKDMAVVCENTCLRPRIACRKLPCAAAA
jgi:hypothetical protein